MSSLPSPSMSATEAASKSEVSLITRLRNRTRDGPDGGFTSGSGACAPAETGIIAPAANPTALPSRLRLVTPLSKPDVIDILPRAKATESYYLSEQSVQRELSSAAEAVSLDLLDL